MAQQHISPSPISLFLDGFFHVDFGSRRSSRRRSRRSSRWSCFRLLLGDAKKTSSSWWFGRNRIEIPRALKVVLVNPNYSKLVKHFIATWQYHGTQNFETFWDFMNGFGRKKKPEKIRSFTASVMSFSMTFKSASCCANKREAFLLGISNGQHSTSPNHWLGVAFVYQADLLVSLTSHHYEKEFCWVKVLQLPSIGHLIF